MGGAADTRPALREGRLGLQADWMKTPSGRTYVTSDNENRDGGTVFKSMAERVPYLMPLYKLHSFLDSHLIIHSDQQM